jgi:Domain of unknown function (DUF4252)
MKNLFQTTWKLAPVLLLLMAGSAITAWAQGPRLQMDQLDLLANKASETVDVKLDERLMATTARFFSKDDADIKEVLKGIKGIYVKSFTFEKEGQYSQVDVDSVMSQLRAGTWSNVVKVKTKGGDNVEVYLNMVADQITGLAVISIEPKEFTVVNIVGPIDLQKLSKLEGQFGVPELGIEPDRTKKK